MNEPEPLKDKTTECRGMTAVNIIFVRSASEWLKKELWKELKLSHGFYEGDTEDKILKLFYEAYEDAYKNDD